ncbi:MAG: glycosyltransferase family 2 protein [Patescibacteria group bacterium]|nr:glycosyltransferase family 2 protein [Patescibacteria group bacterium]
MPEISIVILTKNAGRRFKKVLKAIFEQVIEKKFEVIIIDSGSKDKTLKIAHQFSVAKILEIKPETFEHGKTRNLSLALCQGKYIVFLSQDALPVNHLWLKNLINPLSDDKVAATFSRQIPYVQTNLFQKYYQSFLYPKEKEPLLGSLFFSNVSAAIKKEVLEKIKFPENLPMSEDQAWAKAVVENGYQIVYCPEAPVFHSHNYSFWKNFKRNFDSGLSLKKLGLIQEKKFFVKLPKYLLGEIWFLFKKRLIFAFLYLPSMFIYEFFRFFGFWLGSHYQILPLSWRKKFSLHNKNLD